MAFGSSRLWKILAIFVAVWAAVLIGLDRGGEALAEYEAGKTIQDSQHLSSRPSVDLSGFPFLTQLIAGEFDQVTVDAKGVTVHPRGQSLVLADMHVILRNVSVSRSFDSFHTDTADATALITYADLGATLSAVAPAKITLSYQGNGRIEGSTSLFGLSASVTAQPTLAGQSLHFNDLQISVPGPLSSQVTSAVHRVFDGDLPLTGLPFGLLVQSLTVDQAGVHLTLHGQNISYSN